MPTGINTTYTIPTGRPNDESIHVRGLAKDDGDHYWGSILVRYVNFQGRVDNTDEVARIIATYRNEIRIQQNNAESEDENLRDMLVRDEANGGQFSEDEVTNYTQRRGDLHDVIMQAEEAIRDCQLFVESLSDGECTISYEVNTSADDNEHIYQVGDPLLRVNTIEPVYATVVQPPLPRMNLNRIPSYHESQDSIVIDAPPPPPPPRHHLHGEAIVLGSLIQQRCTIL